MSRFGLLLSSFLIVFWGLWLHYDPQHTSNFRASRGRKFQGETNCKPKKESAYSARKAANQCDAQTERFGGGWLCFLGVPVRHVAVRWGEVMWSTVIGCDATWSEVMWLVAKCHAMSCHNNMWCDVMWCRVMSCHVVSSNAMGFLCGVVSLGAMRGHVMCPHVMRCHLMWSDAMQWDGMLWACHVMWLVVRSCCVIRRGLWCSGLKADVLSTTKGECHNTTAPHFKEIQAVLQSTTPH